MKHLLYLLMVIMLLGSCESRFGRLDIELQQPMNPNMYVYNDTYKVLATYLPDDIKYTLIINDKITSTSVYHKFFKKTSSNFFNNREAKERLAKYLITKYEKEHPIPFKFEK